MKWGRSDLVVRSQARGRRLQARIPIPPILRVWGLLHAKSHIVTKRPPVDVVRKFGDGVPAQVSSTSSDRDSKFRGRPQIALLVLQNGTLI
ncbi:hypothetical protein AVEN_121307-1 [Araneus ventricosus]|uniref:Uncharacterized protein n=1 Tax=Araneus ventricosus TaxID=182803 RepID=A0A4Y2I6K8_ARAVE|nr:hypothetical protein AVEN_51495-1 [Araneus ventricosus]GBM73293.1 hypothetical protein AVEN_121307-1 [Araneus ventricosus]